MIAKSLKFILPFLILLKMLQPIGTAAQGTLLEYGTNGVGVEIKSTWSTAGFGGAGLSAGYSIAGVLDIGADFGLKFDEFRGSDSTEMKVAIIYNVSVLKQTDTFPLSFQIKGSYGLINVNSAYLNNKDLLRRATGFTIGADVNRYFHLSSFWLIRLGLAGYYESFNYVLTTAKTPSAVDPAPGYPELERVSNVYFGGNIGFIFKTNKGTILAVQVELLSNQNLEWQLGPAISIAVPQGRN